jgi:hypothetical protein
MEFAKIAATFEITKLKDPRTNKHFYSPLMINPAITKGKQYDSPNLIEAAIAKSKSAWPFLV